MLRTKRQFYKQSLIECFIAIICLFIFCEYIFYYVVLVQCGYPTLNPYKSDPSIPPPKPEESPVKVMFIADTHLLGSRNGDLFDEGLWSSSIEFDSTIQRFHSLFAVPQNTFLYVVPGNHDMGFHYWITPYLSNRFVRGMKAPNVRRISIRGNHFVLTNSMALEGDGCFICRPVEDALNEIAKYLKCAKGVGAHCNKNTTIKRYSRPILLQHYPMYRESDALCAEADQAPDDIKNIKFRERWECLSKEASEQLLDILNPRLIVDGHTHHGCRKMHRNDTLEITVSSFSWRNKNNPSFLLGIFTPDNYAVSKCYMPVETTVKLIYICGIASIVIYLMLKTKSRYFNSFMKFHYFITLQFIWK
ncbi:hypothetical protein PV327_005145 [Microctonus hyperodae]|uniref:Calcineurin-like phosphoesterase domain-containing protein n=1 Tax=Microctonus hyperodae TaxID=165561 RepID=A0AA39G119_MICHY|nr:hypothetical protein PV327_005145 [Microctonus hyperodae]